MEISPEPPENPAPMSSPAQDIRRVRKNTAVTADELRAFLAELKGKSPKEMLGTIATATLFQAMIQALIVTAALIAVFTILPFAWGKITGGEDEGDPIAATEGDGAGDPAAPSDEGTDPAGTDTDNPPVEVAVDPATPDTPDTPDPSAAETLGIGETEITPSDVNPLDSSNDDLLDGLE